MLVFLKDLIVVVVLVTIKDHHVHVYCNQFLIHRVITIVVVMMEVIVVANVQVPVLVGVVDILVECMVVVKEVVGAKKVDQYEEKCMLEDTHLILCMVLIHLTILATVQEDLEKTEDTDKENNQQVKVQQEE